MYSQAHGCTVRHTDVQTGTQMYRQVQECTVRHKDVQTDRHTDTHREGIVLTVTVS